MTAENVSERAVKVPPVTSFRLAVKPEAVRLEAVKARDWDVADPTAEL